MCNKRGGFEFLTPKPWSRPCCHSPTKRWERERHCWEPRECGVKETQGGGDVHNRNYYEASDFWWWQCREWQKKSQRKRCPQWTTELPISDHGRSGNEIPRPLPLHPNEEQFTEDSTVVSEANLTFRQVQTLKQTTKTRSIIGWMQTRVSLERNLSQSWIQIELSPYTKLTAIVAVWNLSLYRLRVHMVRGQDYFDTFRAAFERGYDVWCKRSFRSNSRVESGLS